MRRKRCRPNAIHYNLLLRAVRDCGVGSEEHVQELLLPTQLSVSRKKIHFSSVMERKTLAATSQPVHSDNIETSVPVIFAITLFFLPVAELVVTSVTKGRRLLGWSLFLNFLFPK